MSNKSKQLPLDLPVEPALGRDDLIVSAANRVAADLIDAWPQWPGAVTILSGPTGAGKSHIAKIWASVASAVIIRGGALANTDFSGLADRNIVVEDLGSDNLPERDIDETALFHLFNLVRQSNTHMLITSRSWPQAWGIQLPDLMSRLRSAQLVELHEPDDELLQLVIVKLFADRQLSVDLAVVNYLINRMERSLGAANRIVDWMDKNSLARNVRISKKLAAEAMQELGMV